MVTVVLSCNLWRTVGERLGWIHHKAESPINLQGMEAGDQRFPRQVEFQASGQETSGLTFKVLRNKFSYGTYIMVEGDLGGDDPSGGNMNFIEKLIKHPEISGNSKEFIGARNPFMDMLNNATGKRYTDNPDSAMAIPVLYQVRYNETGQRGQWIVAGIFKDKKKALEHQKIVEDNTVSWAKERGYLGAESRISTVPKNKRVEWIENLHDPSILLETDITPQERDAMLNSESEMLPSSVTMKTAPVYALLGPVQIEQAMPRLMDIVQEIGQSMIQAGELDFIRGGNAFGKRNPNLSWSIESDEFQNQSDQTKETYKTIIQSLLYAAEMALGNYPKSYAFLTQQLRQIFSDASYGIGTVSEAQALQPVPGDAMAAANNIDIKYEADMWEYKRLLQATITMDDQMLQKLEELPTPTDGEYSRKYEMD